VYQSYKRGGQALLEGVVEPASSIASNYRLKYGLTYIKNVTTCNYI